MGNLHGEPREGINAVRPLLQIVSLTKWNSIMLLESVGCWIHVTVRSQAETYDQFLHQSFEIDSRRFPVRC